LKGLSTSPGVERRLNADRTQQSEAPSTDEAKSSALILVVERDPHVKCIERYLLEDAG